MITIIILQVPFFLPFCPLDLAVLRSIFDDFVFAIVVRVVERENLSGRFSLHVGFVFSSYVHGLN